MPIELELKTPSSEDRAFERRTFNIRAGLPLATFSIYPEYFAISFDSKADASNFGGATERLVSQTMNSNLPEIDKDIGGYLTFSDGSHGEFDINQPIVDVLSENPNIKSIRLNTRFADIWFRRADDECRIGLISHAPIYEEASEFVTSLIPNGEQNLSASELAHELEAALQDFKQ